MTWAVTALQIVRVTVTWHKAQNPARDCMRGQADVSFRSVESHVIPAKAGIHRPWVPPSVGRTAFVANIPGGGPQAHEHSGWSA